MKIAILASAQQKEEWVSKSKAANVQMIWVANQKELLKTNADAYFDLLFVPSSAKMEDYSSLSTPLFLNETIYAFPSIIEQATFPIPLFRLSGWPGFLQRDVIELASYKTEERKIGEIILSALGWKWKWVADMPGLITARVISSIVNEAYFTLEQEVSTKEEIDIAMKLGTNYPYGPFEWSAHIGLGNVYSLLVEMSKQDPRHSPSELLRKETEQQLLWH